MEKREPSTGARLAGIEAARGVAAAAVVLSHAALMTAEPRYYGVVPFHDAFRNLGAGVDFFFVLSGFIISTVHCDDFGKPWRFGGYVRKRFLRILPLYWAILVPLIIVYQIHPAFGDASRHDLANVIRSLLLVPNASLPVLGVAWTLTFEMFFYLLFGIGILCGPRWRWLMIAWAIAIVAAQSCFSDMPFPVSFFLNARNLEFLAGLACAVYLHEHVLPGPHVVLATGVMAMLGGLAFIPAMPTGQHLEMVFTAVFGGASALIVLGLVAFERRGWMQKARRFYLATGACSYAMYLVHAPAQSLFERPLAWLGHGLSAELSTLVLWAVGVSAGVMTHYVLEIPLATAARRALDGIIVLAARPNLRLER